MSLAYSEIWREFKHSKNGIAGLVILAGLVITSIIAVATIPLETFQQWQNPAQWTNNPKTAMPAWMNNFLDTKLPEHQTLRNPEVIAATADGLRTVSHRYTFNYNYDTFLNDFMLNYEVQYHAAPPLLQYVIERPDGNRIEMLRTSLPSPQGISYTHKGTVFSTDSAIRSSARNIIAMYDYPVDETQPHITLFSDLHEQKVLKGTYAITVTFFLFDERDEVLSSELILGGGVYGLLGTDELRR
ncbi:MAG: ABC transporter permease, partial [Nitrososphaerales archaeon]